MGLFINETSFLYIYIVYSTLDQDRWKINKGVMELNISNSIYVATQKKALATIMSHNQVA